MKIVIAPDSFKGSFSAKRFCEITAEEIRKMDDSIELLSFPLADGGEGTLDALCSLCDNVRVDEIEVNNPYFEKIIAKVGFLNNKTAIIEVAQAIGLPLIEDRKNARYTSSYGVGEMVEYAVGKGADNIIFTLGGSSTNDLGIGMLSALGYDFVNKFGITVLPVGEYLSQINHIEATEKTERFKSVRFTAMCDVKNPLLGENGCAYVYAKQKGADEKDILFLEKGAKSFSLKVKSFIGKDYSVVEGAGAAGGLGFAIMSFLNGKAASGIKTVLELCDYKRKAQGAELIITGEGRFDNQSLMGKTIGGLLEYSPKSRILVFAGKCEYSGNISNLSAYGISDGQELSYALSHAEENLRKALRERLPLFILNR